MNKTNARKRRYRHKKQSRRTRRTRRRTRRSKCRVQRRLRRLRRTHSNAPKIRIRRRNRRNRRQRTYQRGGGIRVPTLNTRVMQPPISSRGALARGALARGALARGALARSSGGSALASTQKGGGLVDIIPGASDVRDLYWKGGEVIKNLANTYMGKPPVTNTTPGTQPIGGQQQVNKPEVPNIGANLRDGANYAADFTTLN